MIQIHNQIQENNNETIVKDINECIVCMELLDDTNNIPVKCPQCIYEWCLKCHEQLDKCPYCRYPFEHPKSNTQNINISANIFDISFVRAQIIRVIIFILVLIVLGFQMYLFSGIFSYLISFTQLIF